MPRRRHTPEQIVRKLKEADKLLNEGRTSQLSAGTSRCPSRPSTAGGPSTAA